jgi:hypothetical protein
VGVKYLKQAELLELLRSCAKDPALFDPAPAWLEATTPFLMAATNDSAVPMILEGRHAVLRDDRENELYSLEYTELYRILSEDKAGEEKVRVLGGLLFPSSPILPGESREGLFLFGALDPRAAKAALGVSFLFGDKTLKTQACLFPFGIETISPEKRD